MQKISQTGDHSMFSNEVRQRRARGREGVVANEETVVM